MINLPEDTYIRVVKENDTWIVVQQISPTIALCVREVDVIGGATIISVVLMEI